MTTNNNHEEQKFIPPALFEPAIPAADPHLRQLGHLIWFKRPITVEYGLKDKRHWRSAAGWERVYSVLHSVTLALESTHIQGKPIRLLDSEDGGTKPLRNVCNYLPANTNQVLDDLK
jgi:hypothetical protein